MARAIQWWFNPRTNELVPQTQLTRMRGLIGKRDEFFAVPQGANLVRVHWGFGPNLVFRFYSPAHANTVCCSLVWDDSHGWKQSAMSDYAIERMIAGEAVLQYRVLPITWNPDVYSRMHKLLDTKL